MTSKFRLFGIVALVGAVLCYVAETTFYGGVDADGVVQESFFIPLTFILGALGLILLLASLAVRTRRAEYRPHRDNSRDL